MFYAQSTCAVISGRAAMRTNNQNNETASILCHSLTVLNRDKIVYFFVHFDDGDPSIFLYIFFFTNLFRLCCVLRVRTIQDIMQVTVFKKLLLLLFLSQSASLITSFLTHDTE